MGMPLDIVLAGGLCGGAFVIGFGVSVRPSLVLPRWVPGADGATYIILHSRSPESRQDQARGHWVFESGPLTVCRDFVWEGTRVSADMCLVSVYC